MINKENNTQLINDVVETNNSLLYNIKQIALLELLYKNIEVKFSIEKNKKMLKELGKEEKAIYRVHNKIDDKVKNINHGFSNNLNNEESLKKLRQETYRLLNGIYGYMTEISYCNEISSDILDKMKQAPPYEANLERFYKDIRNFLLKDKSKYNEKIIELIKIIPIRISKYKYYDILRSTIKNTLKDVNKEKVDIIIKRFKGIFNGTLEKDYGQMYDKYFIEAQKYRRFVYKNASFDNIKKVYNKTKNNINEIQSVIEIVRGSGLIVNRLLIISMINELDCKCQFEEFVDESLKEYRKLLNEKNLDSILSYYEKELHSYNFNLSKLSEKYFSKYNNITNEKRKGNLEAKYVLTNNALIYLNDYYLENYKLLQFDEKDNQDINHLEQAIENLIKYIDRNIKSMSNLQRKVRMKRLLTLQEKPFDMEDFILYLKNSVEYLDKKERLATLNRVAGIMNKYKGN
ncbi:MAG: hypothetical protein FH753_02240 [Firmicutes bacterium]|nr:hypothetical protein [Bacillota bacterium]